MSVVNRVSKLMETKSLQYLSKNTFEEDDTREEYRDGYVTVRKSTITDK